MHTHTPDLSKAAQDNRSAEIWAWEQRQYSCVERLKPAPFETETAAAQMEFCKPQHLSQETGAKVVTLFDGRDAPGKGGTIKRVAEYLNPRAERVVALTQPSDCECGTRYFQRDTQRLPMRGEIGLYDQSYYHRPGVERAMGVCAPGDDLELVRQTPEFMQRRARADIRVLKYWDSVFQAEQAERVAAREADPLRRWTRSPIDRARNDPLDDYTNTDTPDAPRPVIRSYDKTSARHTCMRHFLSQLDYPDKDPDVATPVDPKAVDPSPVRSATPKAHYADPIRAPRGFTQTAARADPKGP